MKTIVGKIYQGTCADFKVEECVDEYYIIRRQFETWHWIATFSKRALLPEAIDYFLKNTCGVEL